MLFRSVGHEEGGTFTELVRHRPYSVILFDEIEKAHPEVFNILLQVLDDGRLTDAKGRVVNFKNTIIVMTSNLGAQYIDKMEQIGFNTADSSIAKNYIQAKDKVMTSLKNYFRPEFLNRLDDIIVFDILNEEAIKKIVDIQVDIVRSRLLAKNIDLQVSQDVLNYLAKEGYDPHYGARPLKRLIQNTILTPVASKMIEEGLSEGGTVSVSMKGGEFVFNVKKGKMKSPLGKAVKEAQEKAL